MRPTRERFLEVFNHLEPLIENRWGVPVHIRDVPDPFTGDLDGQQIAIEFDQEAEDALFILVHLFGHTVQWNTSAEAREIGAYKGPWDEEMLARVKAYEMGACRYSMQLFHEAGVTDLDQWLSDFAHCDYAYLEHFYQTGEKRHFRTFWKDDCEVLAPAPLPRFSPERWLSRDGVVV